MKILKRDGRYQDFDASKIENAVLKAFVAIDKELSDYAITKAKNIANHIEKEAESTKKVFTIEEIQDMVEKGLMSTKRKDVAREYISYRNERNKVRAKNSEVRKLVKEKLTAANVQNQNANVDEYSFGGRMGEANEVQTKAIALDELISEMARNNHLNNEIYEHDLGSYAVGMHNCLSIPFDDLLTNGFNTRQTDVRPANSVNTAFQLVAVIFQLQSLQQFGGVSATHLDWTMVPYVRKSFFKHYMVAYIKTKPEFISFDLENILFDDYEEKLGNGLIILRNKFDDWLDKNEDECLGELGLKREDFCLSNENKFDKTLYQSALYDTILEIKQAVEGMYHNLNTLQSRSGNQLPFTSINYGTCTSREGRLIIKSLLKGSIKGVGALHKTSIFPCGIFQCMEGVNRKEGDPNYDLFQLAIKSTAKRLYPNYANVDWSGNAGYDRNDPRTYFSTMGCRTANGYDINAEPGQNPQLKDGRGNICPVTIIMPTLAMEAVEYWKDDYANTETVEEIFLHFLDQKIHEAKDMLIERFEYICSQSPESAKFMYENNTMFGYKPEEGIRSALKHGTLAIGNLGLAETLQILIDCDHTEEKGMELAKKIYKLFKDRCAEFKEQYKLNFGVYNTPAENLCYTAMQKFKKKYGVIENVSDKDFFTNSMHVPVWKRLNPFEKIDIESQLTGYSSAGCITYVEFDDESRKNLDAVEAVVQYAMDHDIPYFAINVPCDTCMECGDCGEIEEKCPKCGSTHIQHLRRVTGYLTGDYKTAFNKGKQQEVEMRVKHY